MDMRVCVGVLPACVSAGLVCCNPVWFDCLSLMVWCELAFANRCALRVSDCLVWDVAGVAQCAWCRKARLPGRRAHRVTS